jgi:hypothetical protein
VAACRLPVVVRRFNPANRTWSADQSAFLTYPAGGLVAASGNGVRYDARRDRWLPAGVPTPDGTGYVYADDGGNVHQVVLDSGRDTVIVRGQWSPIGFVGGQLYLEEWRTSAPSAFGGGGGAPGRLARTSLSGGQPTIVTQHVGYWSLSALGAWTLDATAPTQFAPDRLLHLDLATGTLEPWLSGVPFIDPIGFDAGGHPVVLIEHEAVRVQLLMGRGDAREIYSGPRALGWPEGPTFADGGRVWFSGFNATEPTFEAPVWLYQPGIGLNPSVGVPGAQVSVAGGCA